MMQRFIVGFFFILVFAATARAGTSLASKDAPLTAGELASFHQQVAACWNIGGISAAAQSTKVTVAADLNSDGTLVPSSVRLIGAGESPNGPQLEAFAAAKRAIIRCGARGYKLPLAKYDQWKSIEMTFDPEGTPDK